MGEFSRIFILGVALTLLAACESLLAPPQERATVITPSKSNSEVVTYTSSLRGAYFLKNPSDAQYCAEPPPDVALSTLRELAAKARAEVQGQGGGEASLDTKVTSEAIQLAGRTQLILLTRELLYRPCELSINHGAESKEFDKVKTLYEQVISVIVTFANTEEISAQARRANAIAELEKVRQERTAHLSKVDTIIAHVSTAEGGVDTDKLTALLDKSPDSEFVRDALLGASSLSELRERLSIVSPKVVDQMFAAVPQ